MSDPAVNRIIKSSRTIRVLIVDDHAMVRTGIRSLLKSEPDLVVVGEAIDGEQALLLAEMLQPDVVVTDLSMPGPNGIDLSRILSERQPATRVLLLTMYEDAMLLREAVRAGAAGYLTKRAGLNELATAIREVARGGTYVDERLLRPVHEQLFGRQVSVARAQDVLSNEEMRMLQLLAAGQSSRQLACELKMGAGDINRLRAGMMGKLGLRNRVDLVRYAQEQGLLGK